MIAAVIGEELGLIGISVLVGLYMLFGYAGFRTAQKARDRYGRLLAAGLTAMILVQASINLFAVLGLAPLTGVTLPFVSYGNSSLIVTLAAVGLLLNVANGGSGADGGAAGDGPALTAGGRRRPGAARPRRPAGRHRRGHTVPRIVIGAGGTAGHVVPALAVADALAERGAEVSFIGTRERAEAELVPAAGYEIDFLAVRGIDRRNPIKAALALGRAAAAVRVARRLLRRARRRRGAWAAAATSPRRRGSRPPAMRLPLVLTEADSHLGLDQPAARAAGQARLSRLSDRGARRRPLSAHRPAGAARDRRRPIGPAPASGSGSTPTSPAC